MAVQYKKELGFNATLLLEPKPQEPTKHQVRGQGALLLLVNHTILFRTTTVLSPHTHGHVNDIDHLRTATATCMNCPPPIVVFCRQVPQQHCALYALCNVLANLLRRGVPLHS
jgi:hypothetical protein